MFLPFFAAFMEIRKINQSLLVTFDENHQPKIILYFLTSCLLFN